MALTQTSLSGGRVTGGNHVQYVLVGTGAAQSDAPALGDNITTYCGGAGQPATPSTTGTTSLLCVESSSVPHPEFKAKWAVRAVFDALRTVSISGLSLPTGWYAIEVSPGIVGDMRRGVGKNLLLDVPSAADNKTVESAIPYGRVYPGESGLFAPYMQRYRIRGASRPTRNEVTLYYDPPTIRQVVEKNPDRGFLTCDTVSSEVKAVKDENGKAVWYEDYDTAQKEAYRYSVVKGKGTIFETRLLFRLRFVSTVGWMNTLLALVNTTNNSAMSNWGGARAGALRLAGAHGERALTTDALNYYDILVEANPRGWNEETLVQKWKRCVQEQQDQDKDGNLIAGSFSKVILWQRVGEPYKVKLYPSAGWSALNKLLA